MVMPSEELTISMWIVFEKDQKGLLDLVKYFIVFVDFCHG